MIATVRGRVVDRGAGSLVIEVGGVGLHVMVPERVASGRESTTVPGQPDEVRLYTHLSVRETALDLFGFATTDDRAVFRALLGISGVGPRTALAVVSVLPAAEVGAALAANDVAAFQRVPGVGKKTAQRIVIELAERFDVAPAGPMPTSGRLAATQDAVQGLVALGYSEAAARKAVAAAQSTVDDDSPDAAALLRASLQSLNAH